MTATVKELTTQQKEGLALIQLCKDHPWLSFLCDGDNCSKLAAHPWELDGNAVATNGKCLFRVDGLGAGLPSLADRWTPGIRQLLSEEQTITPLGLIGMDALRAFIQPACVHCMDAGGIECPDCDGEGSSYCDVCENESACKKCRGIGYERECPSCKKIRTMETATRRPCKAGKMLIDRNLLLLLPMELTGRLCVQAISMGSRTLVLAGESILDGQMRKWLYLVCEIVPNPITAADVEKENNLPVLPVEAS